MGEMRNQNIGHGHVYTRPDGMVARCGGPTICAKCALDFVQLRRSADKQAPTEVDKTTDENKPQ